MLLNDKFVQFQNQSINQWLNLQFLGSGFETVDCSFPLDGERSSTSGAAQCPALPQSLCSLTAHHLFFFILRKQKKKSTAFFLL